MGSGVYIAESSAVQCSPVQIDAVKFSIAWYIGQCSVQCSTAQFNAALFCAVQQCIVQCRTAQCSAALHCAEPLRTVQCGGSFGACHRLRTTKEPTQPGSRRPGRHPTSPWREAAHVSGAQLPHRGQSPPHRGPTPPNRGPTPLMACIGLVGSYQTHKNQCCQVQAAHGRTVDHCPCVGAAGLGELFSREGSRYSIAGDGGAEVADNTAVYCSSLRTQWHNRGRHSLTPFSPLAWQGHRRTEGDTGGQRDRPSRA